MSGPGDLERKLRALAADRDLPDPAGRRLDGAPFAALVAEIDGTVLPRRLVFARADGAELSLDVSSRRLRRIVSAPDGALSGRALARGDAVQAARLCIDFLGTGADIRVRHLPLSEEFTAAGISALRLTEAGAEAQAASGPADAFTAAAAPARAALLFRPGVFPVRSGAADELAPVAGDALSATRHVRRAAGPVAVAILGVAGGRRLIVASAPGAEAVFLADAAEAAAVAEAWIRLSA